MSRKERSQLGFKIEDEHVLIGVPLEEIITFLQTHQFDSNNHYYEFIISGKITPKDLRSILSLPYEIAIIEENDRLFLFTGTEKYCPGEESFQDKKRKSKLFFHSHPKIRGKDFVNAPSFSDVVVSDYIGESSIQGIAHEDGLLLFNRPIINPETGQREKKEPRDFMSIYEKIKNVNIFGIRLKKYKDFQRFHDFSIDEMIAFQRTFAEDTGMIIDEALWNDKTGIKRIMVKLFGLDNM